MNWLAEIWHFLFGWPAVDIVVGCSCIAVAVFEPAIVAKFIPNLRPYAIATAVVAFTLLSVAGKNYNDGIAVKQAEWDAALAAEAVSGEKARSDAVAAVSSEPPDGVRNDPRNRDLGSAPAKPKSALRRLASHRLFSKP